MRAEVAVNEAEDLHAVHRVDVVDVQLELFAAQIADDRLEHGDVEPVLVRPALGPSRRCPADTAAPYRLGPWNGWRTARSRMTTSDGPSSARDKRYPEHPACHRCRRCLAAPALRVRQPRSPERGRNVV